MSTNDDVQNNLSFWLDNGWAVVGYNTVLLAIGNVTHFVLIQKGCSLKSIAIVYDKGKVLGTNVFDLAPGEEKR